MINKIKTKMDYIKDDYMEYFEIFHKEEFDDKDGKEKDDPTRVKIEYITHEAIKEKLKKNFPNLNDTESSELIKKIQQKTQDKVSKEEYESFFKKIYKIRDTEFQKETFNILDRSNNGKISPEALYHIFQSLGNYMPYEKIIETIKNIKESQGQESDDSFLYFKDFQYVIDKNRARKEKLKKSKEKK